MNIQILPGIKGAQKAKGIVVVIDVLRAATVSAYLLDQGVETITPVSTKEEAFAYKKLDPTLLLVGEEGGIKIPGFDIGNSPFEIKNTQNLRGKHVIQRSSTGTQGLVNIQQASDVIFGSFVTLSAICEFILEKNPEDVSLVPMEGHEDFMFAELLKDTVLKKNELTMEKIKKDLETHPDCEWFLDPKKPLFPVEDFYLSVALDTFSFFPIIKNDRLVKSSKA